MNLLFSFWRVPEPWLYSRATYGAQLLHVCCTKCPVTLREWPLKCIPPRRDSVLGHWQNHLPIIIYFTLLAVCTQEHFSRSQPASSQLAIWGGEEEVVWLLLWQNVHAMVNADKIFQTPSLSHSLLYTTAVHSFSASSSSSHPPWWRLLSLSLLHVVLQ